MVDDVWSQKTNSTTLIGNAPKCKSDQDFIFITDGYHTVFLICKFKLTTIYKTIM